jgi:hypothetical protein
VRAAQLQVSMPGALEIEATWVLEPSHGASCGMPSGGRSGMRARGPMPVLLPRA